MFASLPMYDFADLRSTTDAWWAGLSASLKAQGVPRVPAQLSRDGNLTGQWTDPDLLLSQTCGYPLTHELDGQVRLLGAPCYDAPGCQGAEYRSFIVARNNDSRQTLKAMRGARAAVNSLQSHSGMNALRIMVAELAESGRFFGSVCISGSHMRSMEMIAAGQADVAAIDSITFALLRDVRPELTASVVVLAASPPAPTLPLITNIGVDDQLVARLRRGVKAAFGDPALAPVRKRLRLRGFVDRSLADYHVIVQMQATAARTGYSALA
ncbi:MAG: PhnD/SsuA/transferrin family substrate-binding protein [Proteobacteria bacterium]|nr:PhnD/SsuA/transferrin family substrate-binding protein [Pseudomonadota bacterium]